MNLSAWSIEKETGDILVPKVISRSDVHHQSRAILHSTSDPLASLVNVPALIFFTNYQLNTSLHTTLHKRVYVYRLRTYLAGRVKMRPD